MVLPCFLLYSGAVASKTLTSRPSPASPKHGEKAGKAAVHATTKVAAAQYPLKIKAKRVDPAVLSVINADVAGKPVTVMVKLNSKTSTYSRHPVSNAPDNARQRAFTSEVDGIIRSVSNAGAREKFRILQSAANLGVATLEAPVSVVKGLLGVAQIDGLKLKS